MKNERQRNEPVCLELLRVSTPKQVELGGLESQHEDCVKIAERNGIKLHPQQIRLAGVSGKNVKLTPEITQLNALLRTGKFVGVVMVEDTRLMRANEPEDYALLQVFKDTNAKIYTKASVHDMSTPDGMMLFQILMAISGRERHVIRQRTYGRRQKLRSKGLLASSELTLPYGIARVRYRDADADRWAYAYDNAKINQVRRAFELVIAGEHSYRIIAQKTNLSYWSVRLILRNTAYIGFRTYDKQVDPSLDKKDEFGRLLYQVKVQRPDDEIERVAMLGADGKPLSPVISPDKFWRVQEILKFKTDMHWRRNTTRAERYLFRGFLRCDSCGQRLMSVSHRTRGVLRDYYVCPASAKTSQQRIDRDGNYHCQDLPACHSPRVRREVLDEMLDAVVAEKLRDPFRIFEVLKAHARASANGDNGQRIEETKKEIASLEAEKARTFVLFKKSMIGESELDRDCDRLNAAIKAAQRYLASLVPVASMISPQALAYALAAFEGWGVVKLSVEEKRALLTTACTEFNVLIKGNGGRGAGARTTVAATGFWLRINAGDRLQDRKPPVSETYELASNLYHCTMEQITNQSPIYIPF
jgi:DNA invertase Pin-like site-specific DNA recombinase